MIKKLLPYLITAGVGAIAVVIIICAKEIWTLDKLNVVGLLSDAFFASGAVIAGVGLIIFASNGGAFRMLSYAMIKLVDLFRSKDHRSQYRDFYEYSESKKGDHTRMSFMLIVGLCFVAVASIFLIVYYNI